ncbi:Rtr1/RPAP2 family-domain-containing protein [Dactylonectria macrodidyma]|uniref:RNA polymerase II subunit B1 CTD phosphatase RPAP2 homolog n=1 Tax=Dactylonectria macrodidyma TaxID=307937 RepID=A0A9P9J2H4_9HYPO|nr:Rtr1/RPAP2 family-domain-containing protein [Dactylonectria macrodidyma]
MAANTEQLPKGILKKPATAGKEPAVDPRELAIQHATILQHRKDIEAQILDNLILLSEYPVTRGAPYSAANPAPSDVADFKANVRLFQPSDYDDLIVERNVNELCGYTLCARPRRQMGPGGEWKIMSNGDIVKRKDLEMWCSQKCARRALYIKVQLNETAAWERAGIPDIEMELLDEDRSDETDVDRAARKLGEMRLEDQRQAARDTAALALERGEPRPSAQNKVKVILKEKLREKDVKPLAPTTNTPEVYDDDHLVVEGYKSKLMTGSENKAT